MSTRDHKKNAPKKAKIAVITVSSSRRPENDKAGQWIIKRAKKEGHETVIYRVVPDDARFIASTISDIIMNLAPDAILITGGTGISSKDVTIEAVQPMFTKELTSYGPIFAQLSFERIDSAAILSRATAGIAENTIIFCMPGSITACKLACRELIFPELGHLIKHVKEN